MIWPSIQGTFQDNAREAPADKKWNPPLRSWPRKKPPAWRPAAESPYRQFREIVYSRAAAKEQQNA
ncbi:MAG TPA: hypothetical protein VHK01_15600 [Lacipirellulaceae bacterium]|jgi:hypothetical protein|nr:hypothetical protein [Lacipirellulaceae bacterium]